MRTASTLAYPKRGILIYYAGNFHLREVHSKHFRLRLSSTWAIHSIKDIHHHWIIVLSTWVCRCRWRCRHQYKYSFTHLVYVLTFTLSHIWCVFCSFYHLIITFHHLYKIIIIFGVVCPCKINNFISIYAHKKHSTWMYCAHRTEERSFSIANWRNVEISMRSIICISRYDSRQSHIVLHRSEYMGYQSTGLCR